MQPWLLRPVLGQVPRASASSSLTCSQHAPASGQALKNGAGNMLVRPFPVAGPLQGKSAFCDFSLKIIFIRFYSLRFQN